eukprot:3718184-Rhodomonas_salina.1
MEEPERGHAGRGAADGVLEPTPSPLFVTEHGCVLRFPNPQYFQHRYPVLQVERSTNARWQWEKADVPPSPRVWPKGLEEDLVLLRFGGSCLPEGMTTGVAGPGVFQNEDPFAMRIHHDGIGP